MDTYATAKTTLLSPAVGAFLITPDDDNDLATVTRGLSFAGEGSLEIVMENGDEIEVPSGSLAPGVIHPIRVRRVKEGTTATGLVGWY